jgi:hypothetical protein
MKIQTALSACIVLMLGGCASYSGNNYRQDIVYAGDGYYDARDAERQDDGYYDQAYYDGSYDNYYDGGYDRGGLSFGLGFGDPFFYGSRYGYCASRYVICPGDPLAMFLFPIGGSRYWLLFDGYDDRSYYYGGGYGWPYWWGYPHHHHHHDHDHDGDGHHRDDPPDPVVVTPPPPNGWVPSPRDGRRFITPHPRKGVFTANGTATPRNETAVTDDGDARARVPRARPDLGSNYEPPMRWRPPSRTPSAPVVRPLPVRDAPEPVQYRRQAPVAPSDQTRLYGSEPVRRSRPEPSEALAPPRPVSRPEPTPVNVPNQDSSDDSPARGRRRGDGRGDG